MDLKYHSQYSGQAPGWITGKWDFGLRRGPKLFCTASIPSIIFPFLGKNIYIFSGRYENLNVEVFLEGCHYVLPQFLSQITDK